jgi:hypothetical protein
LNLEVVGSMDALPRADIRRTVEERWPMSTSREIEKK